LWKYGYAVNLAYLGGTGERRKGIMNEFPDVFFLKKRNPRLAPVEAL